jgi:Zn-dependent M32 family carboxypeptidase
MVRDLRGLSEPYPEVKTARNGAVSVRDATVTIDGNDVRIVSEGTDELDLLRAACAAIWNSGRAIYGLEVPERLYS